MLEMMVVFRMFHLERISVKIKVQEVHISLSCALEMAVSPTTALNIN